MADSIDLRELAGIDQFKNFGLPEGKSAPDLERRAVLEFAEARRKHATRPAVLEADGDTWGYGALLIPPLDYAVLIRSMPELNSKDPEEMHRAWRKFAASELGRQYRADDGIGVKKPRTGIIVK